MDREHKAGYFCYWTGPLDEAREFEPDHRELLGRVLGVPVDVEAMRALESRESSEDVPPSPRRDDSGGLGQIGDFQLLARIGRGAMGQIFRAWDPVVGRQVALKQANHTGDSRADSRFLREIQALGRVDHRHLMKVYKSGIHDEQLYYTMELVDGVDLARVLRELRRSRGEVEEAEWERAVTTACEAVHAQDADPAPTDEPRHDGAAADWRATAGKGHVAAVVELVRQVAEAAHALHENGVVHRDIKPGNVMVARDERHAVLMDLGLALIADQAGSELTRAGEFVGTMRYAAPEQLDALGPVDRRADVYSLGATLWEMLTLQPLFGADAMPSMSEFIQRVNTVDPERIGRFNPHASGDLEAIVAKALAKRPDERYRTARDFAADLQCWQEKRPVSARKLTVLYVLTKSMARHRMKLAAAAAALLLLGTAVGTEYWRTNEARRQQEAVAQVDLVLQTEPDQLVRELHELRAHGDRIDHYLGERLDDATLTAEQRLRARLALVPRDPALVPGLVDEVADADTSLVPAIADALHPHRSEASAPLWTILADDARPGASRIRSALALARLEPPVSSEQRERWAGVAPSLVREVATYLAVHPHEFSLVTHSLWPTRDVLLDPLLGLLRSGTRSPTERTMVAAIFGEYAVSDLDRLLEGLVEVDSVDFEQLLERAEKYDRDAIERLSRIVVTKTTSPRIRSVAAIALLRMGHHSGVWPLLADGPDLQLQSRLIHSMAQYAVPPEAIAGRLSSESDAGVLRALVLALGEYDDDRFPDALKQETLEQVVRLHEKHPHAGVHGAANWLARRWGAGERLAAGDRELPSESVRRLDGGGSPHWYVNGRGQTLVVISQPVTFRMGLSESAASGGEQPHDVQHPRTIDRGFAIASKEVSVGEFQHFLDDVRRPDGTLPGVLAEFVHDKGSSPNETGPQGNVTLLQAAAYCRWLSEQENLPESEMCFPAIEEIKLPMSLPDDLLRRTGYRLPTEAEWEYACRGGTITPWHCGSTEDLLTHFAVYKGNYSGKGFRPCGEMKPNPFGIFDMCGNGWDWCLDAYGPHEPSIEPTLDDLQVSEIFTGNDEHVLRGGGVGSTAPEFRSGSRDFRKKPQQAGFTVVFRIARTLPPTASRPDTFTSNP